MCQRHEICTTKQETQAKTGNEIVPTLPTSKCEKKGWKMSGKVANGKVTVVEYSKSAKEFFEITVTNHCIWIWTKIYVCFIFACKQCKINIQLKIWRNCNFHSHLIIIGICWNLDILCLYFLNSFHQSFPKNHYRKQKSN